MRRRDVFGALGLGFAAVALILIFSAVLIYLGISAAADCSARGGIYARPYLSLEYVCLFGKEQK